MRAMDTASLVRALVSAVPEGELRRLFAELVVGLSGPSVSSSLSPAAEPARRGRRRGRRPARAGAGNGRRRAAVNGRRKAAKAADPALAQRRARYAATRAAKRREARSAKGAAAVDGGGEVAGAGNGAGFPVSAAALWTHAEKLSPTAPWAAVMQRFDVKPAIARQAYRTRSFPTGLGPMAVEKFLALPAG
jgi:hypothetical protein